MPIFPLPFFPLPHFKRPQIDHAEDVLTMTALLADDKRNSHFSHMHTTLYSCIPQRRAAIYWTGLMRSRSNYNSITNYKLQLLHVTQRRAGLRHVRGVRPKRAANFRGAIFDPERAKKEGREVEQGRRLAKAGFGSAP